MLDSVSLIRALRLIKQEDDSSNATTVGKLKMLAAEFGRRAAQLYHPPLCTYKDNDSPLITDFSAHMSEYIEL